MVYFKQTVINNIKRATGDKEVEAVILNSINRLRIKSVHGHIIERYVLSMASALHCAKAEELPFKVKQNVNNAIEVFKSLERLRRENN